MTRYENPLPDVAEIAPSAAALADPVYSAERLAELIRLRLLEVDHAEPLVADVVARAADELHFPISLLTAVLPGAQLFVGSHGPAGWLAEARATPLEWSLCATVVRREDDYVVEDCTTSEATADNPLVTADGIRAYAGVPLRTTSGHVLGALCVLDLAPRRLDEQGLQRLRDLADQVMRRLESGVEDADRVVTVPAGSRASTPPRPGR